MGFSHHFLELIDQGGTRVDGEITRDKWAKWIEITDWSWNAADKEVKDAAAQGLSSGNRIEPSVFSISKPPDRSTIRFLSAMHGGEIFKRATFLLFEELSGQRDAGSSGFHLEVILTDVTVIKYSVSANASDKEVTLEEEWDLNYKTVTFKYDKGKTQVQLTRPPGADDEGTRNRVDQVVKDAKAWQPAERKELIGKLGSLDK